MVKLAETFVEEAPRYDVVEQVVWYKTPKFVVASVVVSIALGFLAAKLF